MTNSSPRTLPTPSTSTPLSATQTGLADIDRRLAGEHDHHAGARKQLSTALGLLADCAMLYARTNHQGKRLANQALTNGIEISEDERATIRLAELATTTTKARSIWTGPSDWWR
ncbi:hypothetical protein AAG742_05355 [Micrococcus sp. 2A]|uniref:hypothetical protein n=1 Tax=Micrococcus sp. 2A TaxID=3142261 RepID=UPI0026298530|nr:hypothetical protein [uncultured Micrococcus sp.]